LGETAPGLTWVEIWETLTFRSGYNSAIVVVGTTLLGIAAGVIGVFALLRKRSLMADALSHATLPGIGLAFIAATMLGFEGRSLPLLMTGATVTGVLGVLLIQWIVRSTRLREDAAIGVVLSVFFGAGVVVLSVIQSMRSGTAAGLNHFIYGQTAAMSIADAKLMGGIALLAILAATVLFKEFALVCFNDAFAKVTGWPISFIDLLMMSLVVIVTVAGLQAVGLILVVSMLIIPAVAARFWTERLWRLLILAGFIGGLSGYLGSVTSALLPRKPAGAVIVLTCGFIFTVSMLFAPSRGVVASLLRQFKLKLRIASDHLLEAAVEDSDGRLGYLGKERTLQLKKQRGWGPWLRLVGPIFIRYFKLGRFEEGAFQASAKGVQRGQRVARNHLLWEQYLLTYADIAPGHIDWTVDQVEHVLSMEVIRELEMLLRSRGVEIPEVRLPEGVEL
jgi:manganese/zinc/iron transport system permease protein